MTMRIDHLANHPDCLPTVAGWLQEAFGHLDPGKTVQDRRDALQASLRRGALPIRLIACDAAGTALGCASVVTRTLTHGHLGPWLSAVYVAPEQRRRGIASALVERAVEECAGLGIGELFLFTPRNESLYARLGWVAWDRAHIQGNPVVVMKRAIVSGLAR
jgi:GNAT superfamily N-acetyltransferase